MVELVTVDEDRIKTGQRVIVSDGHRGTVHYVGPVPPYDGIWLGIDWDDPSRGKHDGVHQGVRYFTARHPTSGSFVRTGKVELGRSCVEAVKLRYGNNSNADEDVINQQLLQVKKAFNAPFLEMVGFEEINKIQSCFKQLKVVWLHDYAVSSAGEKDELYNLSPNIRELHLSRNLLANWSDVVEITQQLHHLTMLNLSENVIRIPDDNEVIMLSSRAAFRNLDHIILTRMNYEWSDVLQCATLWPNVQHLQVPFNNITTIQTPLKPVLYNLRNLDLEGNSIVNWEQINQLGTLPLLTILNLTSTSMSNISIPSTGLFPSLKFLILSHNKIALWTHVSELDKLKLQELKIIDNPVLKCCNKETTRQILIARIGSLKSLNGQEVPREERRGAEYDYIKRYGRQWQEAKHNDELRAEFVNDYGRYRELIKIHGEAESSEYKEVSNDLKSSLLRLEISLSPPGKTVRKSLPRSMRVQRLFGLVQKLLNTGSDELTLFGVSKVNPVLKIPLDNPLKSLDYYSIEDGDQILVVCSTTTNKNSLKCPC